MFEKLWTDKYRPNKLSDITGNNEILMRLKLIAATKNLPNMIFSGMSGTGKTSSAICLVKEIYGDNYSNNVTFWSGSTYEIRHSDMVTNPQTYISEVGLYDNQYNQVAVGRLSSPINKNFSSEAIVKVRLTY